MIALPLENSFAGFQRAFAEAIFSDDAPIPATIRMASGLGSASRFGVYRNNVMASLISAVAARYPVVRKLLWDDAFNRVAHLYVTAEPPRSPVLFEYGEGFPRFLRQIGEGTSADYLAVGPVFSTSSKDKPDPVVGLDGVRRTRELTRKPLVAIGGITRANAASVIEAGADSVAVISDLLREPRKSAEEFFRLLR